MYQVRVHPAPALEYISASVHRLTGHSPDRYYELYRRPELAAELFIPEDREKVEALIAAPEPNPASFVLGWKHADGRTLWMEHRRTPIRDEAGRLLAVVGVAKDITRQKQLEEQEAQHAGLLFALIAYSDAKLVERPDEQTIASGRTVSQIAEELLLSVNTVSTYRARILEKMQMESNAELMCYAMRLRLVP